MTRSLLFGRQGISSTLWKYHTKQCNIEGKRPNVLFPHYWIRIIPPRPNMTKNVVMFECSFQMNRAEIKEYLKSIYNVDTLQVNTEVVDGERFNILLANGSLKTHTNPHKKIAYVTLEDAEFLYPSNELFEKMLQNEGSMEEGSLTEASVEDAPRLAPV